MKSLEKVIKQKCKFRGKIGRREEDDFILYRRSFFEYDYINLYVSNNGVISENIFTLLEEMKPLIVFLFSCIMYDIGEREETRKLHCKLKFYRPGFGHYWHGDEIDLTETIFSQSLHWYDMPMRYIEYVILGLKKMDII